MMGRTHVACGVAAGTACDEASGFTFSPDVPAASADPLSVGTAADSTPAHSAQIIANGNLFFIL